MLNSLGSVKVWFAKCTKRLGTSLKGIKEYFKWICLKENIYLLFIIIVLFIFCVIQITRLWLKFL